MWLGVDFGTSNSSGARLVGGHPHPVREPLEKQPFFPSCVLLRPETGEGTSQATRVLTGVAAQRGMLQYPERFRAEIKRNLGTPWPLLLGGEELPIVDAVGAVMRSLKAEAERSDPVPNALVTVPVAFGSERVALIETAARSAGFESVRSLLEPEAAARYHVYASSSPADTREELLLVYDFGGGTFDATLVRRAGPKFSIIASAGLDDCGGGDIDRALFTALRERTSPALQAQFDASETAGLDDEMPDAEVQSLLRLRLNALDRTRRIKHDLSLLDTSDADFGTPPEVVRFSRAEFEAMVAPQIQRTLACCDGLMRAQSVEWKDVSRVLLVGGTTRIPLIATLLRERFERPVSSVSDPELAVAFGASLATSGVVLAPVPLFAIGLQARIDAATPGQTLVIEPGVYEESLRIDKPLSLVARSTDGARAIVRSEREPAMTALGDGVTLSGLVFETTAGDVTLRVGGRAFTAEHCEIGGGRFSAAAVSDCPSFSITRSKFSGSRGSGLTIGARVSGRIEQNLFEQNGGAGITVAAAGGKLAIARNLSSRNAVGISIEGGGGEVVVSGNECSFNASGMAIAAKSAPLVHGNNVHDNLRGGLRVQTAAKPSIERNELRANGEFAIAIVGEETAPVLRDNTVLAEGAQGVVFASSGGLLAGNRILGAVGVRLYGKTTAIVRGNEIRAKKHCVEVEGEGGGRIEDNRITGIDAATIGIDVTGSAAVTIAGNRFEGAFVYYHVPAVVKDSPLGPRWNVERNEMPLVPLVARPYAVLAAALSRSRWTEADAESVRLLRAACGSPLVTPATVGRVPVEVLATVARLWLLAGPPLATRRWVYDPSDGVTVVVGTESVLHRRLRELRLSDLG